MPLQNRVAPDGSLHAQAARGLFTGNRGVIHDPVSKRLLGRRWTTPAWIACTLEWKGRRREVWGRNGPNGSAGWTELFFLDEVTALAAGHRPCFFCRHADAKRFASAFAAARGLARIDATTLGACLHSERRLSSRTQPAQLAISDVAALPDGTAIEQAGEFFALKAGRALPWSFSGYGEPVSFARLASTPVTLVTPHCVVAALHYGYRPLWHPSAG